MAFWGVEVKPGKPFTHSFDSVKGRLHISQATLGFGSATLKSWVQCNVGNKSPVLLCSLLPDKTDSCALSLEFEETDEVVFSVIGPRSVHLTGYYLRLSLNPNDNSESYGEDIGETETETEGSFQSEEDDYEDSFINDDDPEVFPPSLDSDGVEREERIGINKPKSRKAGKKRLRKKYQISESEDGGSQQQLNSLNGSSNLPLESENEDNMPISSLCRSTGTANNTKSKLEGKADEKTNKTKKTEDDSKYLNKIEENTDAVTFNVENERQSFMPSTEVACSKTGEKPKKKRKRSTVDKAVEDFKANDADVFEEDNNKQVGLNAENTVQNQICGSETAQPHTLSQNGSTTRKRRKNQATGKDIDVENACDGSIIFGNNIDQLKGMNTDNRSQEMQENVEQGQDHNGANDKNFDDFIDNCTDEGLLNGKKIRKKKKKSRTEEMKDLNENLFSSENNGKSCIMDAENKKIDSEPPLVRASSSKELVIEELEDGKVNGKVASLGKKVSVHYIGKLKDSGEVFESSISGPPFKFRLGSGKVIEGWDVGINGMRVGAKRRFFVPPSMGFGSEGDGKNVPPDSWLTYEVELVRVH